MADDYLSDETRPDETRPDEARPDEARPTQKLFRQKALRYRDVTTNRRILICLPIGFGLMLLSVLTIIGAAIYFVSTNEYARKERVPGFVSPDKGTIKIYPIQPGVVQNLYVIPGETVLKDQLLLSLEQRHLMEDKGDLRDKVKKLYHNQLRLKGRALELSVQQQIRIQDTKDKSTSNQSNRIQLLDISITLQKSSLGELIQQQERLHDSYTKGHITKLNWTNLLLKVSQARQQLNALERQKINLQQERDSLQDLMKRQEFETQEKKLRLEVEISRLRVSRFDFLDPSSLQLRAPLDGTVSTILIVPGARVNPSQPVVYLTPKDSKLEVTLMVPARSIPFVQKGQNAELMFDAFPHQHYGTLDSTIDYVTPNPVKGNEFDFPIAPVEPVYLVKTALSSTVFKMAEERIPIKAGMLLNADIKLESRTLLDWFLESILGTH